MGEFFLPLGFCSFDKKEVNKICSYEFGIMILRENKLAKFVFMDLKLQMDILCLECNLGFVVLKLQFRMRRCFQFAGLV